jgi:hypothetical protein
MTISTKTFQNLQPGVSAADDLRVRTPINQALQWLGEGLANEINAEFASISASLSNINSALAQISQSVSVQIAAYAAGRPTFMAHKNGTDQVSVSSATNVAVTFGTEAWDVGSHFASNAWTPPTGKYRITVSIGWLTTNGVDNENLFTVLTKDGSGVGSWIHIRSGTGAPTFVDSILVEANGSNAFAVLVFKSGAGDGAISGLSARTYFCGEAIA